MQKSTKRLLSLLVVLAMAIAMAPAGLSYVAVETHAAAGDANYDGTDAAAKIAHGIEVKEWAEAINEAVLADTSADDGYVKVNKLDIAKTCPVCKQTNITWVRASGFNTTNGTNPQGSNEATRKHNHLVVDRNMQAIADFVNLQAYTTTCILWLDKDASGGRYRVTVKDDATSDPTGADVKLEGYKSVLSIIGNAEMVSTSALLPLFNFTNTNTSANTTLNLYGGTYKHNGSNAVARALLRMPTAGTVTNIYNDVVIGPDAPQATGSGSAATLGTTGYCNVFLLGGTLNMYGGTIQNGYSTSVNQGWNVFVYQSTTATFNMYAGTVKGGSGANGAYGTNVHNRGTFNMYGGTIQDGQMHTYQGGGQVYVGMHSKIATSSVVPVANIKGGTIKNGTNANGTGGYGGNINVGGAHGTDANTIAGVGTLNISGTALIEEGEASFGGNIQLSKGATLNVTGGTIQNGNGKSNGGNIYAYAGHAGLTLTDATLIGGNADINGGSIWVSGGTPTFSGTTSISGGKTGSYGGNLWVTGGATVTLPQTVTVSGGKATYGGNIATNSSNTLTINGTVSQTPYVDENSVANATNGGNLYVFSGASATVGATGSLTGGYTTAAGGSIWVGANSTVNVDGSVSGGRTKAGHGGNIYVEGGTVNIAGSVSDGFAGGIGSGGNVFANTTADKAVAVNLNGASISNGTSTTAALAGNIRINNSNQSTDNTKAQLTIDGNTQITENVLITKEASFSVAPTFTGNVKINPNHTTSGNYTLGETVLNGFATDEYEGTLINSNGPNVKLVWDGTNNVKLLGFQAVIRIGETTTNTGYATFAEAAAAVEAAKEEADYDFGYVKAGEDVVLANQDVIIDAMADITVTGEGTVKGIDASNEDYASHSGSITTTLDVEPEVVTAYTYISLEDKNVDNKYTFHRIGYKIDQVDLRINWTDASKTVSNGAGLGYTVYFVADETLKDRISVYGMMVGISSLADKNDLLPALGFGFTGEENFAEVWNSTTHIGTNAKAHCLNGILKSGAANLSDRAQDKVYGKGYVMIDRLNEGAANYGAHYMKATPQQSWSIVEFMDAANENWGELSAEHQTDMINFYKSWGTQGAWDLENNSWTSISDAAAQQ